MPGDIVLCGGELLDDGFAQLLKRKLGKIFEEETFKAMDKSVFQQCLHDWWQRGLKFTFNEIPVERKFMVPKELFASRQAGVQIAFDRSVPSGPSYAVA